MAKEKKILSAEDVIAAMPRGFAQFVHARKKTDKETNKYIKQSPETVIEFLHELDKMFYDSRVEAAKYLRNQTTAASAGGKARAASLAPERRQEIARNAAYAMHKRNQ